MEIIYIVIGAVLGLLIGWFIGKGQNNAALKSEMEVLVQKLNDGQRDFITLQASSSSMLEAANDKVEEKLAEVTSLKEELKKTIDSFDLCRQLLATANAKNSANEEKLGIQKKEMEEMGKKFNTEFENIANRILETKTEKFTELNKVNLKAILDPLGENIKEFKNKVNETYDKESKERFSLGERVKELAQLNQVISEEARNLTKALKGEAKTQGGWGEMILESILEKSGLRKDEEYFLEYQLEDQQGRALRSDLENKKMRPDAVIKYPDNRTVIIDSKVSLSAYLRYTQTTDVSDQKEALKEHIKSIKRHIEELSVKSYQDYASSLDFVMMFVPNEPAFMLALKSDPEIWQYAYDRKILLISPTNLIAALKLIVDLWKREYQNRNAMEIADRGAKLYDKFVGFIANLERVGKTLDQASSAYRDAYKQLSTGNDNLVLQTQKLKELGIKSKKEIPTNLLGE